MARKSAARRKRKASTNKKEKIVERPKEYAVIPECQDRSYADEEYTTSREEKLWDPEVDVEQWFPAYRLLGRAVLTRKQEHVGISNIEALENSCCGVAEQHITDILHESKYEPHTALQMIYMKDVPQKFMDKWTPEEMKLFTKGVMKHGKKFSIIRRKMLPHKRVEDFAEFYYVWKRSNMAEAWRKRRALIKAEEKEMEEKRKNKHPSNQSNNIPPLCNLPNNKILTRSTVAAAIQSLQNNKDTDDDSKTSTSTSPSERSEETSSAAESTDSSMGHVQKLENELPETATSENSSMKNEQIWDNSMECPKQRNKRKLSIPRKIINFEEESAEIKYVPASIIPQWKRQRRHENVVYDLSMKR